VVTLGCDSGSKYLGGEFFSPPVHGSGRKWRCVQVLPPTLL